MIQQPWNNKVSSQLSLYLSETTKKCMYSSFSFIDWKPFPISVEQNLSWVQSKKKGCFTLQFFFFSLWKAWPQLNVIWFTWVDSKSKTIMGWHSFCSRLFVSMELRLLLFSNFCYFNTIKWLLIPSITSCFFPQTLELQTMQIFRFF